MIMFCYVYAASFPLAAYFAATLPNNKWDDVGLLYIPWSKLRERLTLSMVVVATIAGLIPLLNIVLSLFCSVFLVGDGIKALYRSSIMNTKPFAKREKKIKRDITTRLSGPG